MPVRASRLSAAGKGSAARMASGASLGAGAAMGEHNVFVFRDLLGLSESEYAQYSAAGAIEEGND